MIGENLEEHRPLNVFTLAYHFDQAKAGKKYYQYSLLAAKEAEKLYSYSQAKTYYTACHDFLLIKPLSSEKAKTIIDLNLSIVKLAWFTVEPFCFPLLQEAERLAMEYKEMKKLGLVYHWMGRVSYVMGNPREAEKYCQKCLELAEDIEDYDLKALYNNTMGRVKFSQNMHKEALNFLSQGIRFSQIIGDEDELSYSHAIIAISYSFLGKYEEAQIHFREALNLATKIENPVAVSVGLFSQAIFNFKRFSWTKGIEYCQKALTPYACKELPVTKYMCYIWLGLGRLREGSINEGVDYLMRGIQEAKSLNSKMNLSLAWSFLGEAYLRQERINEARQCVDEALLVAEEIKSEYERGIALQTLSHIENRDKEWDKAENNIKKSITIFTNIEALIDLAQSYLSLGDICRKKKKKEEMELSINRAKKIFVKLGLEQYFDRFDAEVIGVRKEVILEIDKSQKMVIYKGLEVNLTNLGYELLLFLATKPGKWISYEQIYERIWGNIHVELYQIMDHKRKIMNVFKSLIGKNGITEDEISDLLINKRDMGYLLNLQSFQIAIQE